MRKRNAICALVSLGCGLSVLVNAVYDTLANHNRLAAIQQRRADELRARSLAIFGWIDSAGTDLEKDLSRDVIVAGDPVEKLLAKHQPDFSHPHPSFQFFIYSGPEREVTITAQRGRLVRATMQVKRDREWLEGYFFGGDWKRTEKYFFAWIECTSLRRLDAMLAPVALAGPAGVYLMAAERDRFLKLSRAASS